VRRTGPATGGGGSCVDRDNGALLSAALPDVACPSQGDEVVKEALAWFAGVDGWDCEAEPCGLLLAKAPFGVCPAGCDAAGRVSPLIDCRLCGPWDTERVRAVPSPGAGDQLGGWNITWVWIEDSTTDLIVQWRHFQKPRTETGAERTRFSGEGQDGL